MSSDPSAVQSKNDYEQWTAGRDSSRPSPALPRQRGRASGSRYTGTAAQQRARITEMNASMATITRRVLVTAERRAGDELPVVAPS
jgi:hypothetical protein